ESVEAADCAPTACPQRLPSRLSIPPTAAALSINRRRSMDRSGFTECCSAAGNCSCSDFIIHRLLAPIVAMSGAFLYQGERDVIASMPSDLEVAGMIWIVCKIGK